jgi:chemotaxis family two-component system sensor kinase Cph1
MQKFIQDLLAYSRVSTEPIELEMIDCEQILHQALKNLSTGILESGATVTHGPLPSVVGAPTQFLRLFQNLVGNAIKFRGAEAPRIHVSAAEESGRWLFSVSDNGVGIDPSDRERVFMMFERGQSPRDKAGTGLGLAICKKIVEVHGGRIWVDSQPREGSTFRFTIPMSRGELAASNRQNTEQGRQ